MRLSTLLDRLGPHRVITGGDPEVGHVAADSRRAGPGTVFFAVPGTRDDGHRYAAEAARRGATAVVAHRRITLPSGTPLVLVRNVRRALALGASALAGDPSHRIPVIGVTGTNGKTTTSHLIAAVIGGAGGRAALLGTVGHRVGGHPRPATETTPGPEDLALLLREAVDLGDTHAVLEASSHALHQHRTDGLRFTCGVFTNLSGDHLDYHGSPRRYRDAKARLFEGLAPSATAVLHAEDPASRVFARRTRARLLTYGRTRGDVRADVVRMDRSGTVFILTTPGGTTPVALALPGPHNIENALAAAATGIALELPLQAVAAGLGAIRTVPGRLEPVEAGQPFTVLVDYAHTDDALRRALAALRPLATARLIVVFGCGGDRDRSKRPRMAAAAERGADLVILTSDNPRTEDPLRIIDDVLVGFRRPPFAVEADRRKAIARAVTEAGPGDIVLIAGKGHETEQILGRTRLPFDDRVAVRETILALETRPRRSA